MFSNNKYAFKKIDTSEKLFDTFRPYEVVKFKFEEIDDTKLRWYSANDIINVYKIVKKEGYNPNDIEICVNIENFIVKRYDTDFILLGLLCKKIYDDDYVDRRYSVLYSPITVSIRKKIIYNFN
jgi:hypothetical protein